MTDISKTVAELREAYAKATPSLVTYTNTPSDDKEIITIRLEGYPRHIPAFQREVPTDLARVIGESVMAVPTLLDELERVQRERDEWKCKAVAAEQDLAIAGVRGSPPPGQDTTIGRLMERAKTAEAERDALSARLKVAEEALEADADEHEIQAARFDAAGDQDSERYHTDWARSARTALDAIRGGEHGA